MYLLGITYIVKQAVIMVYLGRKQAQQYIRKGVPLENNGECCRVEQSNILVAATVCLLLFDICNERSIRARMWHSQNTLSIMVHGRVFLTMI